MTVSVFLTHDLTCPTSGVTRLGTARVVDGVFSWEPAEVRWIAPGTDPGEPGIPDHVVLREMVGSIGNLLGLAHAENPADPWPWLFSPHGSAWGRVESAEPRRHAWRPRAARPDSLRDRMGAMTAEGLEWFLAGEECSVCGLGRRGAEAAGIDVCSGKIP